MALDFSVLQGMDPAGAFFRGQEAVRAEQDRNMLRQQQAEQMQFQRENMLAQREQRQAQAAALADAAARRNALAAYVRGGMPQGAAGLVEFGEEGFKAAEALRKERLATIDEAQKVLGYATQRLASVKTPEMYAATRAELGRISPDFANAMPAEYDPAQVDALVKQGLSLKDQLELAKPTVVAPGASVYQPGKGFVGTAPEKTPTYTPSADMQGYELAKQEGFKGTFFDYKRQLAEAGRPPAQPREQQPRTTKVELADGTIGVMDLTTGEVTPAKVGGQAAKGKPSAFAEKSAAQRKQLGLDLDRAIVELTDATKSGGLIDQSTGSGAGRLVDVGAGFFGRATPGAIAAGKLAPIADLVLKMVPRFEGPQSDKDTKSYKEAAGQLADSTLPTAIRKQAGLEIVRLMKARKDQFVTPDMAAEGTPTAAGALSPAEQAELEQLRKRFGKGG